MTYPITNAEKIVHFLYFQYDLVAMLLPNRQVPQHERIGKEVTALFNGDTLWARFSDTGMVVAVAFQPNRLIMCR